MKLLSKKSNGEVNSRSWFELKIKVEYNGEVKQYFVVYERDLKGVGVGVDFYCNGKPVSKDEKDKLTDLFYEKFKAMEVDRDYGDEDWIDFE